MATVMVTMKKRRSAQDAPVNNIKCVLISKVIILTMYNMKHVFCLLASAVLLLGLSSSVNAQDQRQEGTDVNAISVDQPYGVKGLYKGEFFVGIGGGANVYFGEQDREMQFHHRIAPAMDVYVGKWLAPWFGLRFAYSGGQGFGITNADTDHIFSTGTVYDIPATEKYRYWQEFNFFGVRVDAMFNMASIVGGENTDRFYDISPYAGFGVYKVYNTPLKETCVGVTVGLFNTFRVSKSVDIVLDIHGTAVPENFEHETGVRPGVKPNGIYSFDGILTAALGVAYNF